MALSSLLLKFNPSRAAVDSRGMLTIELAEVLAKLIQQFNANAAATPARAISASAPQVYTSISNDAGLTWSPATTASSLTASFYDDSGAAVATQIISCTRTDASGVNTLSTSTHTGETVSITYVNNATQLATARITHVASGAVTTVSFQSLTDTTALGGFTGGAGK